MAGEALPALRIAGRAGSVIALLLAALAIGAVAGCGGGSDSSGSDGGDTQAAGQSAASFGQEAGPAGRAAASKTVQDFMRAWIKDDPAKACSLMASSTRRNLAAFSSQLKSPDCAGEVKTVRSAMPAKLLARLRGVQVTGVRVDGDRGIVLYRAQGASWALPVLREGSTWKVGAIAGYPVQ